jgi:hypothetical protein
MKHQQDLVYARVGLYYSGEEKVTPLPWIDLPILRLSHL